MIAALVVAFTLQNGLQVVMEKDDSAPVTAVGMIFPVGGRQETPGRSGFAHLFEHLMFEGSKNVKKGDFDRILETYGGDNNASTHADFTFYYEVVPSNALPVALWLDADRVGWLDVSQHAVKTQIEVVKEERRMRVDNEAYGPLLYVEIASRTFSNWQNSHPTIGSFQDLDAATLKDVRGFFNAYYAPSNGILAVVGDIDYDETKALVTKLFGPIPNRAVRPAVDLTEPAPAGERSFELVDAHAQLPALAVTWRGLPERGTKDYYALAVLARALFHGKSARLYQKLVKQTRSAVEVYGGLGFPISDADEYKAPGVLGGFFMHKKDADLKGVVEAELAAIARGGLAAPELERVKTRLRADRMRSHETRLGRVQAYLFAALLDGDPKAAKDDEKYAMVTSEDVKRVAALLKPEAATWFKVKTK